MSQVPAVRKAQFGPGSLRFELQTVTALSCSQRTVSSAAARNLHSFLPFQMYHFAMACFCSCKLSQIWAVVPHTHRHTHTHTHARRNARTHTHANRSSRFIRLQWEVVIKLSSPHSSVELCFCQTQSGTDVRTFFFFFWSDIPRHA